MPPEGYETVTLPAELVEQIDDQAQTIGAKSRAALIRSAVEDHNPHVSARVVAVESGVFDDLASQLSPKVADELEGRMR